MINDEDDDDDCNNQCEETKVMIIFGQKQELLRISDSMIAL